MRQVKGWSSSCQFCGREDPAFTPEGLDMHYWKDCPMLTQCEYCEQVIEISTLGTHYREECEKRETAIADGKGRAMNSCPLCGVDLPLDAGEEDVWRHHLLVEGCPGNPRSL